MRFSSRDPVDGDYDEPMTLHKYLYCLNDPVDYVDPTGEWGYAQNVLISLQSYYGQLDAILSATSNPADMLNWLPEMNARREYLFSKEVLRNENHYAHINFWRFMANPGPFCPIPMSWDPSQPPGPEWKWVSRSGSPPSSGDGAWINEKTGQQIHKDSGGHHVDEYPEGHYDYIDENGNRWRVDPKTGEMKPR